MATGKVWKMILAQKTTLADPKNKGVVLLLYSVLWFDFQH